MKVGDNIHGHLKKLKHSYNKLLHQFDIDVIHDFRLEIKKLRAFMHLINAGAAEDKKLKIKGTLKAFYNSTGEIRNLQLHRQHVTNLCDGLYLEVPEIYLKKLHQEETKYQKVACGLSKKVSFKRFEKWLINAIPEKVQATTVKDFIIQSRTALLNLIPAAGSNEEALHQIRKVLKDLVYNQEHIHLQAPFLLPAFLADQKKAADLAVTLGDFHDLCITLTYLETFSKAHSDLAGEQPVLNVLKEEWEVRKNEIRHEALTALRHIEVARELQH